MGCNCSKNKSKADKLAIWKRHIQGYNANQIAAQLMFHLACVQEIILGGDPSIVKKSKKKSKPIQDESIKTL